MSEVEAVAGRREGLVVEFGELKMLEKQKDLSLLLLLCRRNGSYRRRKVSR